MVDDVPVRNNRMHFPGGIERLLGLTVCGSGFLGIAAIMAWFLTRWAPSLSIVYVICVLVSAVAIAFCVWASALTAHQAWRTLFCIAMIEWDDECVVVYWHFPWLAATRVFDLDTPKQWTIRLVRVSTIVTFNDPAAFQPDRRTSKRLDIVLEDAFGRPQVCGGSGMLDSGVAIEMARALADRLQCNASL